MQSVVHCCLSSCISQCFLPAACAAPMPAASACQVRWMQHVKAHKRICMRLKSTTSSWILTTNPAGHCIMSVRACVLSYIYILHAFEKCARIVCIRTDQIIHSQGLWNKYYCREKVSKPAPGLIIIHLSSFEVFVYVYVCSLCFCVCLCARESTKGEWEANCVCVCQHSDVIGVSCLTLLEEAGSVESGGPPVSPVVSQAPAHENLFRWIQYCHLNRYQPTFRPFKPIKAVLVPNSEF